ncbi:MAG TPA: hypothetical protein VFH88_05405 [Candidatus Krumholzibacteria bacterium]|nr:hypothetical protein [Candidatus Krumholzibacteria bacterium]
MAARYQRAVTDLNLHLHGAAQLTWNAACAFVPLLAALDAGVALWDRNGVVRRRLLVMFSLLEAHPENADRFLFRPRRAWAHVRTLTRCVLAPFAMLVGTPLAIACRLSGGKP